MFIKNVLSEPIVTQKKSNYDVLVILFAFALNIFAATINCWHLVRRKQSYIFLLTFIDLNLSKHFRLAERLW